MSPFFQSDVQSASSTGSCCECESSRGSMAVSAAAGSSRFSAQVCSGRTSQDRAPAALPCYYRWVHRSPRPLEGRVSTCCQVTIRGRGPLGPAQFGFLMTVAVGRKSGVQPRPSSLGRSYSEPVGVISHTVIMRGNDIGKNSLIHADMGRKQRNSRQRPMSTIPCY